MNLNYRKSKVNVFRIFADKMLERTRAAFIKRMNSNNMDKLLELGLIAMKWLFVLSPEYRENIKGFNGKIAFTTVDGKLGATAVFGNGIFFPVMKVKRTALPNANVTLTFSDGHSMASFITEPSPDIISGLLDNKLNFKGNVNYILRFVYLTMDIPYALGIKN